MLNKIKSLFSKKTILKNSIEVNFLSEHIDITFSEDMKYQYLNESDTVTIDKEKGVLSIQYIDIYNLTEEELIYFELPEIFLGSIFVENFGNFLNTTHGLKFNIKFIDSRNQEYFSKFNNNLIFSLDKQYFLTEKQYKILQYINSYNQSEDKTKSEDEQYKALNQIRALSQESSVLFSEELQRIPTLEIIENIEIDFSETDENSLAVFLKTLGNTDEDTKKEFQKIFSKNSSIKKYYPIDVNGVKKNIVIPKDIREIFQVIKEEREKISPIDLINKKSKIFTDSRMESENVEINYGPRVKGIGFATYRPAPASLPSGINWLEKDFPFLFTTEEKIQLFPEHIFYFSEKLKKEKGKVQIELSNKDGKKNILLENYQLKEELEKIENSIREYTDFKNKSNLSEIISLSQNKNLKYLPYNGYYVNLDSQENMLQYLKEIELTEKDNKENKLEAVKKEVETLTLIDNIEGVEHTENTQNKKYIYTFERPKSLKESIKPYKFQEESIAQLQGLYQENPLNGILISDDMGLGKTLQILTFLAWLKEKNELTPSLILVPSSLVYNWYNETKDEKKIGEIQKFFHTGTFKVKIVKGKILEKDIKELLNYDIVLMTYETLRINHIDTGTIPWKVIVCDEAQKIKNPSALVTTAVKTQNAKFKIACSATPIENTLVDLWCLTDFAKPSLLGSLKDFKERYINSSNEDKSDDELKELNENLKSLLGKFYIRRTKEVLNTESEFPKKILKYEPVILSDKQKKLLREYHDKKLAGSPIIGLIQGMIMTCSHPRIAEKNDVDSSDISALLFEAEKLNVLKNILNSILEKKEKAIIFTKYKDMHIILSNFIHHFYGFRPIVISGDIENKRRKDLLDEYKEKIGFNIIILSPEAAGVGLNITEANHVIHYTRLWNPAKEDQATDRAYRIGQKKNVYVYYPIVFENIYNKVSQEFLNYHEMNDYFIKKENFTSPEENLNKILLKKKMMLEEFFLASPPESSDKELESFF